MRFKRSENPPALAAEVPRPAQARPSGTIAIILWGYCQPTPYSVLSNVLSKSEIFSCTPYPPIIEAGLPNLMQESQCFSCPKRKTALDELHCSFQRFPRSDEQMKVVRHHDKLMQQISSFCTIVKEDVDKEASHPVRLTRKMAGQQRSKPENIEI